MTTKTPLQAIQTAIEGQSEAFTEFKAGQDRRLDELQSRLEEVESRAGSPGRTTPASSDEMDHKKIFENYLRRPTDASVKTELENIQRHMERKAVVIAIPSAGGYAVPELILREIERFEKMFSPVRDLVKVIQIGTSDAKQLVNLRGADAAWVGESSSRTATQTPTFREVVLAGGELYAYPQASNWSLDDVFFDVGAWLAEEVGQAFAQAEGIAVLTGTGSNQPTGMLNDPPTSRDDFDSPIRDVDEYQYVDDGDSPHALTADTLIDLVYKVNSIYRANGAWAMNSKTAAVIRKLKDPVTGTYLWQPALSMGQPDSLLGYKVSIWENMDDLDVSGGGHTKFPVAFGDFRRGYTLADRHEVRITRDEVTSIGHTKFYVRKRVHGAPTNTNAIKWLKSTA